MKCNTFARNRLAQKEYGAGVLINILINMHKRKAVKQNLFAHSEAEGYKTEISVKLLSINGY